MAEQAAEVRTPPISKKLPFHVVIGWGLGSLGTLTVLNVTNTLVLKYVVDIMGISAMIAGLIVAASRVFDAVLDPFMGTISDNTRTRWGRRRPFLLIGAFLCALSPIILFAAPASLGGTMLLVYFSIALLFYAVAYTCFNVPYLAMPVEMTQDRHERTFMFSFRVYGSALGGLIGGGLAPFLVDWFGGGRAGFEAMSYVMALLIFIACISCFLLTARAPVDLVTQADRTPKITQIRMTWRNKPFVWLMLAKILLISSLGIGGSAMAFFTTVALEKPLGWLAYFSTGLTIGMIGSQVVWLQIAKRLGKRTCFLIAALLYALAALSWLFTTSNITPFGIIWRALAIGICGGGIMLSSQAMLPDTLEHELEITGVRHEGVLTGIYTTVERASSALGVAFAGAILSAGGYIAGGAASEQPATAITALYLSMAVVPSVGILAAAAAIWQYKLKG